MRLSKRIYALADSVNQGDSVADIGTDHGYVPMLLMRDGKSPRVIMSDISEGSLAKARETFKLAKLMDKVDASDFRIGDGLETVRKGEVDEIIIGGLGGHTIAQDSYNRSSRISQIVYGITDDGNRAGNKTNKQLYQAENYIHHYAHTTTEVAVAGTHRSIVNLFTVFDKSFYENISQHYYHPLHWSHTKHQNPLQTSRWLHRKFWHRLHTGYIWLLLP